MPYSDQAGVVRPRSRRAAPRRDRSRRPGHRGRPGIPLSYRGARHPRRRPSSAAPICGCCPRRSPGATALTSPASPCSAPRPTPSRPAPSWRSSTPSVTRPRSSRAGCSGRSPSTAAATPGSGPAAPATPRWSAEGFCAKPLALLAAGVPGLILGWGARPWLAAQEAAAGIKKLVIVPDRRPAEGELSGDGKPLAEQHDRDYRRGADRWLLRGVEVLVTPDPGELGQGRRRDPDRRTAPRRCARWSRRRCPRRCRRTAGSSSSAC